MSTVLVKFTENLCVDNHKLKLYLMNIACFLTLYLVYVSLPKLTGEGDVNPMSTEASQRWLRF